MRVLMEVVGALITLGIIYVGVGRIVWTVNKLRTRKDKDDDAI